MRAPCRVIVVCMLAGLASLGSASDASSSGKVRTAPVNARFQAECGSCHVAYSPRLLPAESWGELMRGLERHFGVDASVEPAVAEDIASYLLANADAGGRFRPAAGTLRITQTPWFRHKHDEVPAAVWKRPAVGGPSNCGACHPGAAAGLFGEHDVRLPR